MKLFDLYNHFFYYLETFSKNKLGKGLMNPNKNGEYVLLKKVIDQSKNLNILDIGSNVGSYTKKAISLRGDKSLLIHSIDANPEMKEYFKQIDFKGFTYSHVGVGKSKERKIFYSDKKVGGKASSSFFKHYYLNENNSYEVEIHQLDDIITQLSWDKIDLLKIDIEGSEMDALEGAEKSFEKEIINITQLEYNPTWIKADKSLENLFNFKEKFSLDMFRLTKTGLMPLNKYHHSLDDFNYQNIILIKKGISIPMRILKKPLPFL